eukprot:2682024-Alexandrium_andersonii.AAC.1
MTCARSRRSRLRHRAVERAMVTRAVGGGAGQGRRRSSGPPARPLRGDGYRVRLIQPDRSTRISRRSTTHT